MRVNHVVATFLATAGTRPTPVGSAGGHGLVRPHNRTDRGRPAGAKRASGSSFLVLLAKGDGVEETGRSVRSDGLHRPRAVAAPAAASAAGGRVHHGVRGRPRDP